MLARRLRSQKRQQRDCNQRRKELARCKRTQRGVNNEHHAPKNLLTKLFDRVSHPPIARGVVFIPNKDKTNVKTTANECHTRHTFSEKIVPFAHTYTSVTEVAVVHMRNKSSRSCPATRTDQDHAPNMQDTYIKHDTAYNSELNAESRRANHANIKQGGGST